VCNGSRAEVIGAFGDGDTPNAIVSDDDWCEYATITFSSQASDLIGRFHCS
jgi:hypothetical protein